MENEGYMLALFEQLVVAAQGIDANMKRIADALHEPNAYGEVGSAALANSIARGLAGNSR